jgi:hypothetical protein
MSGAAGFTERSRSVRSAMGGFGSAREKQCHDARATVRRGHH